VARTNKGLNGMPDGVPDGGLDGGLDGGPVGGPNGSPTGCQMGIRGGRTECPTGPDGVPEGSHVIGHIIFECHVTCLGWLGVILLPTLLSQC
jgi:hypothetical protein